MARSTLAFGRKCSALEDSHFKQNWKVKSYFGYRHWDIGILPVLHMQQLIKHINSTRSLCLTSKDISWGWSLCSSRMQVSITTIIPKVVLWQIISNNFICVTSRINVSLGSCHKKASKEIVVCSVLHPVWKWKQKDMQFCLLPSAQGC